MAAFSAKSIEEALLGNLEKISKIAIISPIFYPSVLGLKANKTPAGNIIGYHPNFTFIKTFPASNWVFDTVYALRKTFLRQIVFLGSVAGLSSKLKIGDVLLIDKSWDFSGKKVFNVDQTPPFVKTASGISVCSFFSEDKENLEKFNKKKIEVLDFEIFSFYSACQKANLKGIALAVVQDLLPKKPFYLKLNSTEQKKLESGIKKLLLTCLHLSGKP